MELSGTSFSAPVVAGTAAQMLAAHPTWTPDQVKGALMLTTRPASKDSPKLSTGAGEVNADRAIKLNRTPPNPNLALDRFVKPDAVNGGMSLRRGQLVRRGHRERLVGLGLLAGRLLERRSVEHGQLAGHLLERRVVART